MRSFALAIATILLPVAAWAANTPNSRAATAQTRPALSDAQIDAAIKVKLSKSKIGQDGFKARVQGGVVYWEGTTNVIQHKGAATRMAKTAGARAVVNNIKISESGHRGAARSAETRRASVMKR